MSEAVETLLLDFVSWLAPVAKPYREVMEVWRTSCPRLTVWEDALDLGLVIRRLDERGTPTVSVTELGRRWLTDRRAPATPEARI